MGLIFVRMKSKQCEAGDNLLCSVQFIFFFKLPNLIPVLKNKSLEMKMSRLRHVKGGLYRRWDELDVIK